MFLSFRSAHFFLRPRPLSVHGHAMKASTLTSAAIFNLRLRRCQVRRQRHKEKSHLLHRAFCFGYQTTVCVTLSYEACDDASVSLFVLHLLDRSFCIPCHPLPTLLPTLPCCCSRVHSSLLSSVVFTFPPIKIYLI